MTSRRSDPGMDFFSELKEWSEIKLRIVDKYLDSYMRIRGGSKPLVYFVDGFAGPGYYGLNRQEGSAIRTARFAYALSEAKPYRLSCIYTESDEERCGQLSEALKDFDPNIVQIRCGPFLDQLPHILQAIKRQPAIVFLDPFGVKGIAPADLVPLLQRRDTELIVNFNTPRLMKLAGFEDSTAKDAAGKRRLVSYVLGEDPRVLEPEWRQLWLQLGRDGVKWADWAARRYAEKLTQEGIRQYALSYPVREYYGGNPKYHLIFATRSMKAIPVMNDIVSTEEDELFEKVKITKQLDFLGEFRDSSRVARLRALTQEIHIYGLAHQGCNREQIFEHFTTKYFGQLKKKHYRYAVGQLIEGGRARFEPGKRDDTTLLHFL